jgi:hypothetical protein
MNATEIILFAGLALYIIATQLGRRPVSLRRFFTPLIAVVAVAVIYLKGVPTVGGDLPFELACTAAGLAFGVLAASLVRVERDGRTGRLVMQAGIAYAAVWALVFGGRLAFGWAASGVWRAAVGQFSMAHAITGEAAWTAAFVLMAIAMVGARTAVLAVRAALVARGAGAARPALA